MLSGGTGEKLVVGGSGEMAYLFVTPKLSGESLGEEALGVEAEAEAAWKAEELSDLGVNGRTKKDSSSMRVLPSSCSIHAEL